jgi:hypothetical protein
VRRPISLLVASLFALSLVAGSHIGVAPVSAATIGPTTRCSNGVDDTPGLGLICRVTIVNTFTTSGSRARVTVRECHGAAGDPTAACTTQVQTLNSAVTRVTQCNASTNGGGGTLRCSVDITNRFVGIRINESAVTINQCVGSGDGIANNCDPFPSSVTGAAITQCNGSANGGTLVGLTCTATGTSVAGRRVTINQCNGSTNGGGALVICAVRMSNTFISTGGGSTPTGGGSTAPPTSTIDTSGTTSVTAAPLAMLGLLLVFALTFVAAASRRVARREAGDSQS